MLRTLELDGIKVARMGLGTNRLTDTQDNIAFIRGAVDAGIGMIDTAHVYTGGESQATIGAALPSLPESTIVATKGGYRPGEGRPEVLRQQIERSLRDLATDRIPLYYLHRLDPETSLQDTIGLVSEYLDAGRIRLLGISDVKVEQIEAVRRLVPVAAVQNEYNLSERRHDDVVDYCEREGILFVPYRPLRGTHPAVPDIARSRGATPSQIALAWLLHRSPAILPIPGTLSLAHLRENLGALDIELTDQELAALA